MAEELLQIPGYKIQKKMGQGGMATVYLAVQESFGRNVALKIMSSELGADDVWARRFIHEAKVVAQLSHPNIVPVFDVGTCQGRFYISMELLKGGNLDDKIAKGISIAEVVKIIVGVAAGLDFAGEKGFVHRDIKPDNVMFREDGSPVILDFGIVKQMGAGGSADKMTQTGTIVGTTAYMSPEQAMGKELDQRSDIYSLGIMMYELLAGRTPFQGDSAVDVLMKHVTEPPAPLPDFVSIFQPIIDKSLAKNREDRYGRAREMIEHIQELEPEIRQLLAQQKAAFTGATNEATVAQGAIGTAPGAKLKTAVTKAQTKGKTQALKAEEDDLTSVLSSAKATISNFSEEARVRRARNTKRGIIAAAVVVVLALGYVAYQQFYVVPRAAELAGAHREEKITELLELASIGVDQLTLSDIAAADAVITQYREVLVLDPENADAFSAMNKLGARYIELANAEATAGNLSLAEAYREYVEQLSPKNPQLLVLRETLKNARAATTQQELAGEFKQQQIAELLGAAEKNIQAGQIFSPVEDNAYGKFQQILRIDPENTDAQTRLSGLTDNLYSETQGQITAQQWRIASDNLDLLDRYHSDKTKVGTLKTAYASAKQKADQQAKLAGAAQKKEALLSKAAQLKAGQRTRSSNGEMRSNYQEVLNFESTNAIALAGLEDTSRFSLELAEQAIKQRDYSRAAQDVTDVEKTTPNYAGLTATKTKLSAAKSAAQKADQLLASAMDLTNSPASGDIKRQDLAKAYAAIDGAKLADASHPGIAPALTALENQYLIAIGPLMAAQQRTLVDAYFADAANKDWPTNRIMETQLSWKSSPTAAVVIPEDKPKPKRVMSGGF
jgi:serine/threonine-protein kinase PpkA